MGCDIHLYVERRADGVWQTADEWHWDEDEQAYSLYKWGPGLKIEAGPLYRDRNYDLFAMLADVRNGRGFAGVDTGDRLEPVHSPRGLPEDACPEVVRECDRWGEDGHSHSWATVSELLAYDWTRAVTKRGYVSPKEFCRYRLKGSPESWCGDTSGQKITEQEMLRLVCEDAERGVTWSDFHRAQEGLFDVPCTQISWNVRYYERAREFLSEAMPKLWRVGAPDDVRIVYWFDN